VHRYSRGERYERTAIDRLQPGRAAVEQGTPARLAIGPNENFRVEPDPATGGVTITVKPVAAAPTSAPADGQPAPKAAAAAA
jgi:hypothetical protein